MARTEYRIGTGAWTAWTSPLTIGSAATVVQYRALDVAGNVEVVNGVTVPVAGSVPVATRTVALATTPVKYGRPVAVTVKVTSTKGTPTGKVRVLEGSRNLGTTTLSGGAASFRLRGLAVGTHRDRQEGDHGRREGHRHAAQRRRHGDPAEARQGHLRGVGDLRRVDDHHRVDRRHDARREPALTRPTGRVHPSAQGRTRPVGVPARRDAGTGSVGWMGACSCTCARRA
nr:Ig-like domain-containing protein [Cellulomonas sp. PSBB021]